MKHNITPTGAFSHSSQKTFNDESEFRAAFETDSILSDFQVLLEKLENTMSDGPEKAECLRLLKEAESSFKNQLPVGEE